MRVQARVSLLAVVTFLAAIAYAADVLNQLGYLPESLLFLVA